MACRPLFGNNVIWLSMYPAPHINSLILVGQIAVVCCTLAIGFFRFLQGLYSFFSASPHRSKVLTEQLSSEGLSTVKRMLDTCWSARADATKALVEGYEENNDALVEMAGNEEEKAETREEARGLAAKINKLETGILATLLHHILHRFHANSQALQTADQDLNSAVAIYESLIDFIGK